MVEHPVRIQQAGVPGAGPGPAILQRTDQDFLSGILDDLKDGDLDVLATTLATTPGGANVSSGVLKLFQPVHDTFHVALIDVACDTFGLPRLDPTKIVGSGLVVRRYGLDDDGNPTYDQLEGWRTQLRGAKNPSRIVRGWVPFADGEREQDPDPQQRPPELKAGHPEIDRLLALQSISPGPLSEDVAPLFLAPTEVCEATGRTILCGLVPVTSSEFSEVPDTSMTPMDLVQQRLPSYLQAATGSRKIPYAGKTLTPSDADLPQNPTSDDTLLQDYIGFLQQVMYEFDAFGDSNESKALFALLNEIQLWYGTALRGQDQDGNDVYDDVYVGVGDALNAQAETLVQRKPNATVTMPQAPPGQTQAWPPISDDLAGRIANAVKSSLDARLKLIRPHEGRFDGRDRQYCVRAFVRVKDDDGCPPKLFWSDYSKPFTIAAWYDNSDVPPVQIVLPDLTSDNIKALKPNVSFVVPPTLQGVIQGSKLKSLIDGSGPPGSSVGVDWICSFSLPLITFCAFIVLNIFLSLLDIVFFWMAFIKICIPIPKRITSSPR